VTGSSTGSPLATAAHPGNYVYRYVQRYGWREFARLDARQQISQRYVHEYHAASRLLEVIDARARNRWTVLTTDVWGLPWVEEARSISHGRWAAHDECGTVQKLKAGRVECRICPPEPDSRSNRARRDDPHLLYLVRYRGLKKFGHGDERRVRAHLRATSAEVVQAVRARHGNVPHPGSRARFAVADYTKWSTTEKDSTAASATAPQPKATETTSPQPRPEKPPRSLTHRNPIPRDGRVIDT